MIDIRFIREQPDVVDQALKRRRVPVDLASIRQLDAEARGLQNEFDNLRSTQRKRSEGLAELRRSGGDTAVLQSELQAFSERMKDVQSRFGAAKEKLQALLDELPNLPDDDVPSGGKENNQVVRAWGDPPQFDFTPRDHVDLVGRLGLIDYERGTRLAGSGMWIYRGNGALLEWALLNLFIDQHVADGFELLLPPHLLNSECGYVAGQFPKFADDVFYVEGEASKRWFLLPTAETALINVHRGEILAESQLPIKYCSYTPCYRKEAGSHRTEERGMIRGHQFNKVEMVEITTPEQSSAAHEELLERAERLVRLLGLHHRVTLLAAEDTSAAMAKTYDVEVWIPSMNGYKEVSSVSNSRSYQARRGDIRFRPANRKQTEFVHTLNGSGLATSRLIPAIVEQFQRADGTVVLPPILQTKLGVEILQPAPRSGE